MRKGIMVVMGGLALLAGCGGAGEKASTPPAAAAKWKAPYQIEFDSQAAKPNPAGIALPAIKYTATAPGQEKRAALVVRFDSSGVKTGQTARDQMITGSLDLSDSGTLPASYMDATDKGLATMLAAACMKGPVKVKVALVRSSIKPYAGDAEIDAKRLSEWAPTEVVFKNPHPKC